MRQLELTKEQRAQALKDMAKLLANARSTKDISLKYALPAIKDRPNIALDFTASAWVQMRMLVDQCTEEIAWHGITSIAEDRTKITVNDILVYPQIVSPAQVTTDDAHYEEWHQALEDDQYNNLLLQGHSHVNMGVSPSGPDKTLYETTLNIISPTGYYVFLITNKKGDFWVNIYDLKENVLYETADVDVMIEGAIPKQWFQNTVSPLLTKPTLIPPVTKAKKYVTPTYKRAETLPNSYLDYSGYKYFDDETDLRDRYGYK